MKKNLIYILFICLWSLFLTYPQCKQRFHEPTILPLGNSDFTCGFYLVIGQLQQLKIGTQSFDILVIYPGTNRSFPLKIANLPFQDALQFGDNIVGIYGNMKYQKQHRQYFLSFKKIDAIKTIREAHFTPSTLHKKIQCRQ